MRLETDDRLRGVGADSETAGEPRCFPTLRGEEYPLQDQAPVEEQMPLGDREAEGRGLGE
jgi:hypothetical protein